jgi:hypothetical protein
VSTEELRELYSLLVKYRGEVVDGDALAEDAVEGVLAGVEYNIGCRAARS